MSLSDNSFPADEFKVLHGLLSVKWKTIAPYPSYTQVVNTSSSERYSLLLQQMMGCFLNTCHRYLVVIMRFLHDEKEKKHILSSPVAFSNEFYS